MALALFTLFLKEGTDMFREFVKTLVGGAIGLATLYMVAKIAYRAGHEMAEAECQYHAIKDGEEKDNGEVRSDETEELSRNCEASEKSSELISICATDADDESKAKRSLMNRVKDRFLHPVSSGMSKASVLRTLFKHPEAHQLEACIEGEEVHINIKKRAAYAQAFHGEIA